MARSQPARGRKRPGLNRRPDAAGPQPPPWADNAVRRSWALQPVGSGGLGAGPASVAVRTDSPALAASSTTVPAGLLGARPALVAPSAAAARCNSGGTG